MSRRSPPRASKVATVREVQPQVRPGMLRAALPNAITIAALMSGLTAIMLASNGQISQAIGCVLLAAALDGCDGRVARLVNTSSLFGAELDSLADVVSFGAAPALIVYEWGIGNQGMFGWAVCLTFAAATALRLARFNTMVLSKEKPAWAAAFFQGVPSPAGAFLALLPIYLAMAGLVETAAAQAFGLVWLPVVAALMVSNLPTLSGKLVNRVVGRAWIAGLALVLGFGAVLTIGGLWPALAVAAGAYVASLPVGLWRYLRMQQRKP